MSLLDLFRSDKRASSADLARERLQLVVAHRRGAHSKRNQPDYFPKMQQDLLQVLRKYVEIDEDAIQMEIDRDGELEILELNVTLPDQQQ